MSYPAELVATYLIFTTIVIDFSDSFQDKSNFSVKILCINRYKLYKVLSAVKPYNEA
jgi:hypothetical protein